MADVDAPHTAPERPAPPRPRKRRRGPGWVPDQHGAWAMLAVPLGLGMVQTGPAWVHLPLAIVWILGYLAFYATGQWLRSHRKKRWFPPVRAYVLACIPPGLAVVALRPDLLAWVPLFLPLLATSLVLHHRREDRSLLNDVVTVVAACLVLPVAHDAGLDVAAPGDWAATWVATALTAGYFIGTVPYVKTLIREKGSRAWYVGSVAFHVALCALFRDAIPLNAARVLAGLGGGFTFVSGGVLAAGVTQRNPERAAFLLGLFYAGPGLGILLSGVAVPFTLERFGAGSWGAAWAALAVLSLPLAVGLHLARGESTAAPPSAQASPRYADMRWLLCGYLFFGAGYIAYMTFMIAWVQGSGGRVGFQAVFWAIIGLATMASPWLWTVILKRFLHGHAFAILTGITAIGAMLPLISNTVPMLLASAALFGSAFFAVVAATTAFVRRNFPQAEWASAIGILTVVFGIGQMLGPVAIGFVNDVMQNLESGLWASVVLLFITAMLGALQRDPEAA